MSIYDDLATLQTEVANLKAQIETMKVKVLEANDDLHALDLGNYVVPNTTVSATLLNKPTTNTSTAFISVVEGGTSGQKMMYYYPCAKEGGSYYQCAYYQESYGPWHEINVFDSGWLDLTLQNSVIAFNDEQKPQYRRMGKMILLRGVIKNVSAFETVVATLPVNYRPVKRIIFAIPSTGTKFSRISINPDGRIVYEQSSDNVVGTSNWHSVACSFTVD